MLRDNALDAPVLNGVYKILVCFFDAPKTPPSTKALSDLAASLGRVSAEF
jgi:hypothetical protein